MSNYFIKMLSVADSYFDYSWDEVDSDYKIELALIYIAKDSTNFFSWLSKAKSSDRESFVLSLLGPMSTRFVGDKLFDAYEAEELILDYASSNRMMEADYELARESIAREREAESRQYDENWHGCLYSRG